jgi:hypothetical protein
VCQQSIDCFKRGRGSDGISKEHYTAERLNLWRTRGSCREFAKLLPCDKMSRKTSANAPLDDGGGGQYATERKGTVAVDAVQPTLSLTVPSPPKRTKRASFMAEHDSPDRKSNISAKSVTKGKLGISFDSSASAQRRSRKPGTVDSSSLSAGKQRKTQVVEKSKSPRQPRQTLSPLSPKAKRKVDTNPPSLGGTNRPGMDSILWGANADEVRNKMQGRLRAALPAEDAEFFAEDDNSSSDSEGEDQTGSRASNHQTVDERKSVDAALKAARRATRKSMIDA